MPIRWKFGRSPVGKTIRRVTGAGCGLCTTLILANSGCNLIADLAKFDSAGLTPDSDGSVTDVPPLTPPDSDSSAPAHVDAGDGSGLAVLDGSDSAPITPALPGADAGVDAGKDAAVRDSGSIDAALPPPPDAAVSGGAYCPTVQPTPAFCADFDTSPIVSIGWATDYEPGNASLTLRAGGSRATRGAMLAAATSLPSGTQAQAILNQKLQTQPRHARISFDFRGLQIDPNGETNVMKIELGSYPISWGFALAIDGASAGFQETIPHTGSSGTAITYASHPLSAVPGVSDWTQVVIDLDTANQLVSVWFNGVPQLTNDPVQTSSNATGELGLIVGINYEQGPMGATQYLFDNVVIQVITP